MYRKMLATPEEFEALSGQLIRIEAGPFSAIGIVKNPAMDRLHVKLTTASNSNNLFRVLRGTYACFVTTADEIRESEDDCPEVRWRDAGTWLESGGRSGMIYAWERALLNEDDIGF